MKGYIGTFWTMLLEDGGIDSPDSSNICEGDFPDSKSLDVCKQISVVHPMSQQAGDFLVWFLSYDFSGKSQEKLPVKTWVK